MTRRIVAFFASSFLLVSITIPSMAEEAAGVVETVDRESTRLTLSDGTSYLLPSEFDYGAVHPGMRVHVIFDLVS